MSTTENSPLYPSVVQEGNINNSFTRNQTNEESGGLNSNEQEDVDSNVGNSYQSDDSVDRPPSPELASTDVDTPFINPISFLNTMHQKLKTTAPPVYSFTHDSVTGQFYCQVHFCGQTYQNQLARPKKQAAKEEVASIAMRDLSQRMPDITTPIRTELVRAHISSSQKTKNGSKKSGGTGINNINNNNNGMISSRQQQVRAPHPLELIPKSAQWYNKQMSGEQKRPCVMLLEFCQMHRLGHPVYNLRDDGRGNYLYDCTVIGRVFTPELAFWQKNDAKDHISSIAFNILYTEFCEREAMEIQYKHGHVPLPPHTPPPPYGNTMTLYPPTDGGYIPANNVPLMPANHVFANNGNNVQNHVLITRNS
ncbi:5862_t:CDS:1 [Acaulospora colombiana]|uniref:5862_t:CDS:1 n=1 Tax=Acaulospora colombiana TaxID=27376 RepID=A0ACA9NFC7_9GLOM|nr:5862_t:CDS:1 [Acaulospora colombiana]